MPDDQEDGAVDQIDPAEHAALKAELAALNAKTAMLEAGVDLSTPTGKMFLRAYDGDVDVEKIKVAAAEIPGVLKAPPAPAEGEAATGEGDGVVREPGEEGQFAERSALTTGDAAGQADPNPQTEALKALNERVAGGARIEDAGGLALQALVEAANQGDLRVLSQPNG